MNRRETLFALLLAPLAARAQSTAKLARIIVLSRGTAPASPPQRRSAYLEAFVRGLQDLGYVEGKTFVVEGQWTLGRAEDLPKLAKVFATSRPDVVLATGEASGRTAQQVTTTIPVVLAYSGDPVAGGFAKSLAHPGGNVTGLATLNEDTSPKLLELLLTVVPKLSRVPVLANPTVASYASVLKNLQEAAKQAKVDLLPIQARNNAEIDAGFARIAEEKARGVVVLGDPLVFQQRLQISDLALKYGVASVYPAKEHVDAGGLMSYGVNIADGFRRAAAYVDKILKGAKPGDLPIQQATTLELVVNLKTARALGLAIPQSVLVRADRVIE